MGNEAWEACGEREDTKKERKGKKNQNRSERKKNKKNEKEGAKSGDGCVDTRLGTGSRIGAYFFRRPATCKINNQRRRRGRRRKNVNGPVREGVWREEGTGGGRERMRDNDGERVWGWRGEGEVGR